MSFCGTNLLASSIKEIKNSDKDYLIKDFLYKKDESDYILGAGDQIAIRFSAAMPQKIYLPLIPASGYIFLPDIGKIFVDGLTTSELSKLLTIRYEEIIREPQVEINIISYRPVRVYVKGEVESPGLISLAGDFNQRISSSQYDPDVLNSKVKKLNKANIAIFSFPTIFDALQGAGGITSYSNLSEINIIRKDTVSNGGGSKKTIINFLEYINNNDRSQNIRILDDDIVIVKRSPTELTKQLSEALKSNLNPKFVDVFVTGRVKIPGRTTVSSSSSLSDAIDVSGGAKFIRGPVTFIRFNKDGSVDKRVFSYNKKNKRGSFENPYLRNGDILRIGDNIFTNTAEIFKEFTSPFIGIYGTYKLFDDD